jgi:predicted O-methyltransferase YrrM
MRETIMSTASASWRLLRSRRTQSWPGFGEAFNGQAERTEIIHQLIAGLKPAVCIETGTFFGFTSAHLAELGVPVYTIERDPGLCNVSRIRLLRKRNVRVLHGDSASVLPNLAADPAVRKPFVYLDAHWGERLPLVSEVETVLSAWPDCVIVVDDFLVPHDSAYGYDTYDGQALSLEILSLAPGAIAAYPSLPAAQETGARRGTLYVGQGQGASGLESLIGAGRLVRAQ